MNSSMLDAVIARSQQVLEGDTLPARSKKFGTYAISSFRGGIGKSTLSFNLAYEMSRKDRCLLIDTCSQRNFSQNIFGDSLLSIPKGIYHALIEEITSTQTIDYQEIVMPIAGFCPSFVGGKHSVMIAGSQELFLFPSLLYSQLAQYNQLDNQFREPASKKALLSLQSVIQKAAAVAKPDKVLVDTSPFFGGATHLAWCAAEALIIPVRVDQHSIDALKLTLQMLVEKAMDFQRFNAQAGFVGFPKVHAIAMTHCGWSRQKKNTPDSSTLFFAQKALEIAAQFPEVFSEPNVDQCFYLLDDFHSSGRISGKQRIPLAKLTSGTKYLVDGQRLEVNPSVDRYKLEIKNLAAAL